MGDTEIMALLGGLAAGSSTVSIVSTLFGVSNAGDRVWAGICIIAAVLWAVLIN